MHVLTNPLCNIIFVLSFGLLVGCATASYTKPVHVDEVNKYKIVVDKEFDQVWKELISYSATTFFAIDNFEKDSGLITLTFGASKPSDFITGGRWIITGGSPRFDGDYVDYLAAYLQGNLNGKMNIVVSRASDSQTQLAVTARYIFSTPPSVQQGIPNVWSFDTGTCGTSTVALSARGTGTAERTICPTYKAENEIITYMK